jgi:hypothetical protein
LDNGEVKKLDLKENAKNTKIQIGKDSKIDKVNKDSKASCTTTVEIPSDTLRKVINKTLGEKRDTKSDITKEEMESIKELDISSPEMMKDKQGNSYPKIKDIEGLQYAVNLEKLNLRQNKISDLTPLKNLNKLNYLNLHTNNIKDLTPLKNLNELNYLDLHRNDIKDLTPLSGLVNLKHLDIYNNEGIVDIKPITGLTNLQWIDMHYCNRGKEAFDVAPLGKLVNLEYLSIESNFVEDISFVNSLPKLKSFSCAASHVTDLTPVSELSLVAYDDWNDDLFLNMYGQTLKEPIKISTNDETSIINIDNPVKGLDEYTKKLEDMYGVQVPAISLTNDDENSYFKANYNYDNDKIEINIEENTSKDPRHSECSIDLNYDMYTLKINLDITQEGTDITAIDKTWEVSDFTFEGKSITGFSEKGNEKFKTNKDLIIPALNESGEEITQIADRAFIGDMNTKQDAAFGINSVKIPDTVTTIGKEAFRYNALTSIDIPDSVTTIKSLAFNANKLQSLAIPDSVTELEGGAFTLNEIADLKIPSSLKTIPAAFGYNNLTTVTIPEGVTRIDDMTFSDNKLIEVKLPSTLKYLSGFNNNCFESITIPNTVEELGLKAFARNKMTSVVIPGNVKVIGKSAFQNSWHDKFLTSVTIEEGVEKIEPYAFSSNQLKDVELPSSIKELNGNSFYKNLGHDGKVHLFTHDYKNPNKFEESKYHVINPAKIIVKYKFENTVLKEQEIWKNTVNEEYLHIGDTGVQITPEYSNNEYELENVDKRNLDLNDKENELVIKCKKKEVAEKITIKSIGTVAPVAVDIKTSEVAAIDKLAKTTFIIDSNNKEHIVNLV